MEHERTGLLGKAAVAYDTFPWLVKFLDAADWLSVQVHPDEEAVRRLWPGEGSKTEAWFILDAQPGSRIYAGLNPGVDEARLRSALEAGMVADELHQFEPRPGDCLFLPAGTVHAVGGGVLMAEVQQTSDATFRLFDWNRRDAQGKSRTLHIEQALACIDWQRGPVTPIHIEGFSAGTAGRRQPLVSCRYFTLEYLRAREPFACGGTGRLEMALVLAGQGQWATPADSQAIQRGQVWVFPAAMPQTWCQPDPELSVLYCTLP
jgi:mannose-6-phosphate isomerase